MHTETTSLSADVEALLAGAGLPVADLAACRSLTLLGVREGGRLAGVVGVEVHGSDGLLRSLAVEPARRDAGLGTRLVADAEAWAAGQGVRTLYLLTTTAARFFAQRGYEEIPRAAAPAAIAATAQFAGLCPSSSAFMRKRLVAGGSPPA